MIEKDVRGEQNRVGYLETESGGAQIFFSTIKYTFKVFFFYNSIESEINGGRDSITERSCSISLEIPYARVAVEFVKIL